MKMKLARVSVVVTIIASVMSLTSCTTMLIALSTGIDYLPQGDFVAAYDSPSGAAYTLNIYLFDGGATTDFFIRGELVTNQDKSKKNIYWCSGEEDAVVVWHGDEAVTINKRTLRVPEDQYMCPG